MFGIPSPGTPHKRQSIGVVKWRKVTAASSTISPIITPSLATVIFGVMANGLIAIFPTLTLIVPQYLYR